MRKKFQRPIISFHTVNSFEDILKYFLNNAVVKHHILFRSLLRTRLIVNNIFNQNFKTYTIKIQRYRMTCNVLSRICKSIRLIVGKGMSFLHIVDYNQPRGSLGASINHVDRFFFLYLTSSFSFVDTFTKSGLRCKLVFWLPPQLSTWFMDTHFLRNVKMKATGSWLNRRGVGDFLLI